MICYKEFNAHARANPFSATKWFFCLFDICMGSRLPPLLRRRVVLKAEMLLVVAIKLFLIVIAVSSHCRLYSFHGSPLWKSGSVAIKAVINMKFCMYCKWLRHIGVGSPMSSWGKEREEYKWYCKLWRWQEEMGRICQRIYRRFD